MHETVCEFNKQTSIFSGIATLLVEIAGMVLLYTYRAHITTHRKENLACFKMLLSEHWSIWQCTEKMHNLYLPTFVSQYVQHPSQSVQLVLKSLYRGLHFIWNYQSPKCTNVGSSSVRLPMHWFFDCPWHIDQEDSIFVLISWFLWVPFPYM